MTFGLGGNHGGTALMCTTMRHSSSRDFCFSALQGTEAVLFANAIAKSRGDTKDLGHFRACITCYAPELVKVKSNKVYKRILKGILEDRIG